MTTQKYLELRHFIKRRRTWSKLDKCQLIAMAWDGLDSPPPAHDWLVRYLMKQNRESGINDLFRTARQVLTNKEQEKRRKELLV